MLERDRRVKAKATVHRWLEQGYEKKRKLAECGQG